MQGTNVDTDGERNVIYLIWSIFSAHMHWHSTLYPIDVQIKQDKQTLKMVFKEMELLTTDLSTAHCIHDWITKVYSIKSIQLKQKMINFQVLINK